MKAFMAFDTSPNAFNSPRYRRKLSLFIASNDGTYMRLEDADDTFDTGADVVVEHVLLLLISLSDSRQIA